MKPLNSFQRSFVVIQAKSSARRGVRRLTYNPRLAELRKKTGPDGPFLRALVLETRQRLERNEAELTRVIEEFKALRAGCRKYLPSWMYRLGTILFTAGEAGAMWWTLEAFQDAKALNLVDLITGYAIRGVITAAMTGLMYLGSMAAVEAWTHRRDPDVPRSQRLMSYFLYLALIGTIGSMRYLSLDGVGTALFNTCATLVTTIGPALLAAYCSHRRNASIDIFDRKADASKDIVRLKKCIAEDKKWLDTWSDDQLKAEIFGLVYANDYEEHQAVRSASAHDTRSEAC